mmetsp:Transcript_6310/g.15010  ORF Transcript_6310/g.15010 Transcript_6310/m.15010 type:complete len:224 (+) Transcript_6310:1402-2073(+)
MGQSLASRVGRLETRAPAVQGSQAMRHKAVRASCIPQTIHLIEGRNTCQVLPLLVDMCLNSLKLRRALQNVMLRPQRNSGHLGVRDVLLQVVEGRPSCSNDRLLRPAGAAAFHVDYRADRARAGREASSRRPHNELLYKAPVPPSEVKHSRNAGVESTCQSIPSLFLHGVLAGLNESLDALRRVPEPIQELTVLLGDVRLEGFHGLAKLCGCVLDSQQGIHRR